MKRLVGLLLLTAFVVAFGVGYLASSSPTSADPPPPCTTTCSPVKCPLKCKAAGYESGSCVKTGPNCYKCQCILYS